MITFDEILPKLTEIFRSFQEDVAKMGCILVNRDLNGRVRLIVGDHCERDEYLKSVLLSIAQQMYDVLAPHAYPAEQALIFEPDINVLSKSESIFPLEGVKTVYIIDRLAVESNWSCIVKSTTSVPRTLFFSIKGGVGRSTALAATAWSLAEQGKKVLVLDLDLESPGISSALLPEDRRPLYGITDWLVEDLELIRK